MIWECFCYISKINSFVIRKFCGFLESLKVKEAYYRMNWPFALFYLWHSIGQLLSSELLYLFKFIKGLRSSVLAPYSLAKGYWRFWLP